MTTCRCTGWLVVCLVALSGAPEAWADEAANERAAIEALKRIASAQTTFRDDDKDGNGESDYAPNLRALAQTGLIGKTLGTGVYEGYRFEVTASPKQPGLRWMATATPVRPNVTGQRSFAINQWDAVFHALKPFTHNADCKLVALSLNSSLRGWVKDRAEPQGPLGAGWREATGRRIRVGRWRSAYFLAADGRVAQVLDQGRKDGRRELLVVRMFPKTATLRFTRAKFDDQGQLVSLSVQRATHPKGARRTLREARREKATIRIVAGQRTETRAWKPNTVTLDQALFLLPQLARCLPPKLRLKLARIGEPLAGTLTLALTDGRGGARTATLTHTTLGTATVGLDARGIQRWKGFDGTVWKRVRPQVANDAFVKPIEAAHRKGLGTSGADGEAGAIEALKLLIKAQQLFRAHDSDRNRTLDYAADLKALGKAGLIDAALASGTKHGYRFRIRRSAEYPEFVWLATASPIAPGKTGTRHFAVSQRGIVWHALKPYPQDAKVDVKGIPVGEPLPGWTPNRRRAAPTQKASRGSARKDRAAIGRLKATSDEELFRDDAPSRR